MLQYGRFGRLRRRKKRRQAEVNLPYQDAGSEVRNGTLSLAFSLSAPLDPTGLVCAELRAAARFL
jgi:hypothetical protein